MTVITVAVCGVRTPFLRLLVVLWFNQPSFALTGFRITRPASGVAAMNRTLAAVLFLCTATLFAQASEDAPAPPNKTTRPVIRGTQYAVVSMKPQASQTAENILRAGGNAFDAVVAGQAVLGLVDCPMNGVGSDAVLLVYDAKERKVYSINAEGTAPKLATVEWYKQNAGGKIPASDTLLSASLPGAV